MSFFFHCFLCLSVVKLSKNGLTEKNRKKAVGDITFNHGDFAKNLNMKVKIKNEKNYFQNVIKKQAISACFFFLFLLP